MSHQNTVFVTGSVTTAVSRMALIMHNLNKGFSTKMHCARSSYTITNKIPFHMPEAQSSIPSSYLCTYLHAKISVNREQWDLRYSKHRCLLKGKQFGWLTF